MTTSLTMTSQLSRISAYYSMSERSASTGISTLRRAHNEDDSTAVLRSNHGDLVAGTSPGDDYGFFVDFCDAPLSKKNEN